MLIATGVLIGLLIALLWPGNPASRALLSVTAGLHGTLSQSGRSTG